MGFLLLEPPLLHMKNRILLILICVISLLQGCSKEENSSNYSYTTAELELVEKVVLGEKEYFNPSSASVTYKSTDSLHSFMSNGGVIRTYDSKGSLIRLFDKNALENSYEYPGSLPTAFDFTERNLFLFFGGTPTVFVVDEKDSIVDRINLKLGENHWIQRAPYLEVNNNKELIYISIANIDSELSENNFFSKSSLIGVFNFEGDLLETFGKFPKEYESSGKFSRGNPFRYYQYLKDKNTHYFLFDIMDEVYMYNENKKNWDTINIKARVRSYDFEESNIPFFSKQSLNKATNDVYHFISHNPSNNKLYIGTQRLLEKHPNKDDFLLIISPKEKSIKEVNLTKYFGIQYHALMPSTIASDTLTFFLASPFSDKVHLIKTTLK